VGHAGILDLKYTVSDESMLEESATYRERVSQELGRILADCCLVFETL
jgi:hypothetical protein